MDNGVWAITYELRDEQQSEYLAWFHDVHMPEKLSRSGYLWAAHYELEREGYLALFGAPAARVFLDPSPGQLAQRQGAATRTSGCSSRRPKSGSAFPASSWRARIASGPR